MAPPTRRSRQLKLGAVLMGVGGPGQHDTWRHPEIPGDASIDIRWYAARAQQAEAALFDLVFIVDSQFITPHSPPHYLNRLEPLTLLSALAVQTSNIGLVGTLTTSYNSPFNLARRLASLDLISGGRAGWNVVATGDGGTAGNYGLDEHYDYATRYDRALEHVRVAQGLWDSYEDDAFPRDRETGVFLDPAKQHRLDHRGEHFSVVGPLNISRSPQGRPVIFQAGDSEEARAQEEAARLGKDFGKTLAQFGRPFGWHDFSRYDLDAPFPELGDLGVTSFRTRAEQIKALARENGYTLRQTVEHVTREQRSPFVASPRTVADEIQRWFEAGALDGLNVTVTVPSEFARFTDEVLPILRERGVVRSAYEATTLRGNLGLPVPRNRHTGARDAELVAP